MAADIKLLLLLLTSLAGRYHSTKYESQKYDVMYKCRPTRNSLHCDQSNYSSRIVFSHIPIEFGQTGNSTIQSADPENPTVEPNMKWIGRSLAEIWPFEIFPNVRSVVGRNGRSSVGRSSIYTSSYTDLIILLFATLGKCCARSKMY